MEIQENLQKICIVVCIGIPGAGKTTFCKRFQEIHENIYNFIFVNYDDYCNGDFSYEKRKEILQKVECTISRRQKIEKPLVVLIDDNMFYKSMRSEYKRLARKYRTSFLQLYFEVRLELALQRNNSRDNKVPDEIICNMIEKLQVPDKNCHKINSNIGFIAAYIEGVRTVIDETLENPIEQKIPKKSVIIEESQLNRIDIILRQIVSQKIQENKSKALDIVNKRKEILAKIKKGEIFISDNMDNEKLHLTEYFLQ